MTENGDPRKNTIAERLNGIIKEEYIDNYEVSPLKEANQLPKAVVDLHNDERPCEHRQSNTTKNSSFKNKRKTKEIMEELLSAKTYFYKAGPEPRNICKFISGLMARLYSLSIFTQNSLYIRLCNFFSH